MDIHDVKMQHFKETLYKCCVLTSVLIFRDVSWLIVTYHNRLWENPSEFHEKSWPVMICIITFQRGKDPIHAESYFSSCAIGLNIEITTIQTFRGCLFWCNYFHNNFCKRERVSSSKGICNEKLSEGSFAIFIVMCGGDVSLRGQSLPDRRHVRVL